ncbi:MBL fold metallo-hydrolase [Desulfovibrio litoralis]|uniref:Glyoxylase, beta-lactamase superfamily II n=1 Tax=Desulfovibrio litoralis DSM 11393 TaxID=1121455 RepID=A0A1M7RX23_9BACT|nr:MBL fold metallo-hydrolase [Desulfovibrio litoralis]SHN50688.1 Glyoxylase, beta-lactamase superfamily II [Desulfovibrio litoralis DSM 11393]
MVNLIKKISVLLVTILCFSLFGLNNIKTAEAKSQKAPIISQSMHGINFGTVEEIYCIQDLKKNMPIAWFEGVNQAAFKKLYPKLEVPASTNVFLLKQNNHPKALPGRLLILIDAGAGSFIKDEKGNIHPGQLSKALEYATINPNDIDAVLITHLHFDHIGGLLDKDNNPVFKNATIYINAKEKAYWLDPEVIKNAPEAAKPNFDLVQKVFTAYGDKIKIFEVTDQLIAGFKPIEAYGHTPGHTAFEYNTGKQKLMFWGDAVHGAAIQFPNPSIAFKYDVDPQKAIETRIALMKKAASEKYIVFGAHLPFYGFGRVEPHGKGFIYKNGR